MTIQNLRAYEIQYLKQIIKRLSYFISDLALFSSPSWNEAHKKSMPHSLEKTYQFCESLMGVLLDE